MDGIADKDVADGDAYHLLTDGSTTYARIISPARPVIPHALATDVPLRFAKTSLLNMARRQCVGHKLWLRSDGRIGGERHCDKRRGKRCQLSPHHEPLHARGHHRLRRHRHLRPPAYIHPHNFRPHIGMGKVITE